MVHMEEASKVLELLESLGLKGPKLAVFRGDGAAIGRQVAARLGIEGGMWLSAYLDSLIEDAVATRDLELRVRGDHLPEPHQRVSDAMRGFEEARRAKDAEEKRIAGELPPPKKGKLAKIWAPRKVPVEDEHERRTLVISVLMEELKVFGAPILGELGKALNPERAAESLLGKYRPSTAKRYLSYWQGFRRWVFATTGKNYAVSGIQLVDYLYAREEEGMGCSIPMAIQKSVTWFEKAAGVAEEESLMAHPMCQMVISDLTMKLEDKAPPVKRAPRLLSVFIPALERVVMDRRIEEQVRMAAWLKLVKVWASLRFDALANVRRSMVRDYDGKLGGVLKKTKTTGAGKRVRELPIFISEKAYVVEEDWLDTGLRILKRMSPEGGEYLVGDGLSIGEMDTNKMISYQEAVILSMEAMSSMKGPEEGASFLLPEGWGRDEGSVLEDLKVWLREKWGVSELEAATAVEAWKIQVSAGGASQSPPMREDGEQTPTEIAETTPGSPCDSSEPTEIEPSQALKRPRMSRLEESRSI